jgi:NTE family protein
VILAGAVAKGAFEAGALQIFAESDVRVARIVAASSGALNGVAYASAVRGRREREGAAELVALWRDRAAWSDIVHVDLHALVRREGVSDLSHVRAILRRAVRPVEIADRAEVELRIILAPLDGADDRIGDRIVTTYERMVHFDGASFDSEAGLEEVFTAVCASASFPLVFAPTEVPGVGRCVDGGAVNNTPIGWALDDLGAALDAVVVIAPTPERLRAPLGEQHGMTYVSHLIDMLINERLYRDLREAEARNAAMRALAATPVEPHAMAAVRRALGWETARPIDIVQIRPLDPLPGGAFSAFRDEAQREAYLAAGAERAKAVLGELGWLARG